MLNLGSALEVSFAASICVLHGSYFRGVFMSLKRIPAEIRSYGIYNGWDRESKELPEIVKHTHDVPAEPGVEFGYTVRIRKARGKWLRFCIAHPGIPDEDGQVMPPFEGRERIKSNDYQFFLGDCIWEPTHNKVGRWQLSTWIEDELVADQKFMVQVPQPEAKESRRPSPYKDPQRQF